MQNTVLTLVVLNVYMHFTPLQFPGSFTNKSCFASIRETGTYNIMFEVVQKEDLT